MKFLLVGVLAGANLASPSEAQQLLLRQRHHRALSSLTGTETFVDMNQDESMSMDSILADVAASTKSGKSTIGSKSSKSSKSSKAVDWCPDAALQEVSSPEEALAAFLKENTSKFPSKKKGKARFGIPDVSSIGVDKEPPIDEIVGGYDVNPPRKYKFFGQLRGCAASLIAPNVIVSAAHCFEDGSRNAEDGAYVTLGMHTIDVEEGDVEEFANIEHIPLTDKIIHPCYDPSVLGTYDVVVAKLEWSTELYKDYVVDMDRPDDEFDLDDGQPHELVAIGFGALFWSGPVPDVLQEVTQPYDPSCGNIPPGEVDVSINLCAGGEAGKGICFGDSGSALIDPVTNKLVGLPVVLWGCGADGYPNVFTRISAVYDWIESYRAPWASEDIPQAPEPMCAEEVSGWYNIVSRRWLPNGCIWYAEDTGRCSLYGDSYSNGGLTANEACCACSELDFPSEIDVDGVGASDTSFDVDFHYTGSYAAQPHGLEEAMIESRNVSLDEYDVIPIPLSGAAFFRAALPPFSVEDPRVDLDLYLLNPDLEVVDWSWNWFTDEVVEVTLPVDGTWYLQVHGWDTVEPSVDYTLYFWIISLTPGGSLSVDAPDSAVSLTTGTINLSWPYVVGKWYLGAVSHTARAGMLKGLTLVNQNNIGPLIYPKEVDVTGQEASFDVAFAYDGNYTASAFGLSPASVTSGKLAPRNYDVYSLSFNNVAFFRAVLQPPEKKQNPKPKREGVYIHLYLLDPSNQEVSVSENAGIDQVVEIVSPPDGDYSVYLFRRDWEDGDKAAPYEMHSWTLPATPGSMTVAGAPGLAQFGDTGTVDLSWSGGANEWSLGAVIHSDGEGEIGTTIVNVDNRDETDRV